MSSGATAVLLLVAMAVCTALIVMVRGPNSRLRDWFYRIRPLRKWMNSFARVPRDQVRDPVNLAASVGLQLGNLVLDAATLQATLAAAGHYVAPGAVFTAFVFASVAEMIGVVPGGLGTFEGTCVALLHGAGVGLEPALTATLLLRGLTFWLPMVPGLAIARRELGSKWNATSARHPNLESYDKPASTHP